MEELKQKLMNKAMASLSNPMEITPLALEMAITEAMELVNNKPIPQTALLDLALFRLMISYQIVEIPQWMIDLSREAIKLAKQIPTQANGGIENNYKIVVEKLGSEW